MSKVTQAVIMVGGKGTRLRPLTDTVPKPILPVLDRPCLSYLMASMAEAGVDHIILACGYRSEQLVQAIGDGSDMGIEVEYSYEDEPMGTAGAIKILEDRLDDTFIAANGDVFASFDIRGEIGTHISSRASVTIALTPVDNPSEFGVARTDPEGRITEFVEKPGPDEAFSNMINAGVYVAEKDIMRYVPRGKAYDFSRDLVPFLIGNGHRVQGYEIGGTWIDVGRPKDLIRANLVMAAGAGSGRPSGSKVEGAFFAGAGSEIRSSDLKDCVISRGSDVRGSRIHGSLIFRDCRISGSRITDSIIGKGCTIISSDVSGKVIGDGKTINNNEEAEK